MLSGKILITGATGSVGNEVVKCLVDLGQDINAAVRNMDKACEMDWDFKKVNTVLFDYTKPATWHKAFQDVDQLLLVAPPGEARSHEMLIPVINYAQNNNVQKIVMISAIGVDSNDQIPLRIVEKHLEQSQMNFTILRCNWFMQNFLKSFRDEIRYDQVIHAPAGEGKISFIDARDIASFASAVFTDIKYNNHIYHLTGNEALSFTDVAQIFSNKLCIPIKYDSMTDVEARIHFLGTGMAKENIEMYIGLYNAVRQGYAAKITTDVLDNLHREPIAFNKFVRDHLRMWTLIEPEIH